MFSKDSVLAQLCSLDVDIALSTTTNHPRSIVRLALQFPLLVSEADLDRLQEQWRELPHMKETLSMIKLPVTSSGCRFVS